MRTIDRPGDVTGCRAGTPPRGTYQRETDILLRGRGGQNGSNRTIAKAVTWANAFTAVGHLTTDRGPV